MLNNHHPKQAGFTLVEVGIVVPMGLLILGIIFSYLVTMYVDNLQKLNQVQVVDDVNITINKINKDLSIAAGYQTQISSYLSDAFAPVGGWVGNSSAPTSTVIGRTVATSANLESANKKVVRLDKFDCSADAEIRNPILYTNTIYFVTNGNLYKRTLAKNTDSSALPACDAPFQRQTCGAANSGPTCFGKDILLTTDVTEFRAVYGISAARPEAAGEIDCYQSNSYGLKVCPWPINEANILSLYITIQRTVAGEPFSYQGFTTIKAFNSSD